MSKKIDECPSCQNLNKRLKVLQADYDFEIKKLSEDKSTQKALLELNTNREIKKLQQKCLKQKQQRAKQNQLWMTKYDELIERQKQQMAQYKIQKDNEVQHFKKVKNLEMEKFQRETVNKLKEKIENMVIEKENLKIELKNIHEKDISTLALNHEDKLKRLILSHEEKMKKNRQQYEATILGIRSEMNVEESLHRKTKEESKQIQSKLHQQIYQLRKNIFELDETIVSLKSQIQQKCQKIESLHGKMLKMQKDFAEQKQQLSKQYEEKYDSHKKLMEKKLEHLFKRQLQNCTKYEKALEKIEEHREIQNKMYKANLSEVKGCVDQRPSRYQDVEQIIKLREKLTKKQRQCQCLLDELKYYRLELENKEETYNKIFGLQSKITDTVLIRRKELKMRKGGRSVSTVRQPLGLANINPNILLPLQKRLLPPKQNKIL